jgi:Glycosyltransferase family 17
MLVDTFLFCGELDMLECRLTEIGDVVDRFVLVEAAETFQGGRREFVDLPPRFERWTERIVWVRLDHLEGESSWQREAFQREQTVAGLGDVPADAYVMHGDVDEIPDARVLAEWGGSDTRVLFMRHHAFALDWQHRHYWPGTVIARRSSIGSFLAMRNSRFQVPRVRGGWHLSWLGAPTDQLRKLHAQSHTELLGEWDKRMADNECTRLGSHPDGSTMIPVDVDDTWPRWVVEGNAPASWYRPR